MAKEEKQVLEAKIESALRSRIQHFRENADSFTMEKVRRLIENDLELEKCALDVHKRFIKQFLEKLMETVEQEKEVANTSCITQEKQVAQVITQEKQVAQVIKKKIKEPTHKDEAENYFTKKKDEAEMDDSPIMGVMSSKSESLNGKLNESTIKKAIWERAVHFRANSGSLTLAAVRRLLEEDLGLEEKTVDAFKKFIANQVDEVLRSSEAPKSTSSGRKTPGTAKKSDETENVSEKVKLGKRDAVKGTAEKSGLKKRKSPQLEDNVPASKKQKEVPEKLSDESSDGDTDKSDSESAEMPVKKKIVKGTTAGYGKRVEHLRSVIKACGMSVAPSVYKRAKQVSDDKRDGVLIKELEKILSAEGLSTNPSEKEIKEVKKRKETAKELEGIDLSNIVSNTRRRSTSSFFTPPRPKSPAKKDVKNDDKDGDVSDSDDDDDDDNDDDNEDDNEDNDSSQSEEVYEDDNEDSE